MADLPETEYRVEIALLKQRQELMEKQVQSLDDDIKSLRIELKQSFEKVFQRFDTMRDEMLAAKGFGKGVYLVAAVVGSWVVTAIGLYLKFST